MQLKPRCEQRLLGAERVAVVASPVVARRHRNQARPSHSTVSVASAKSRPRRRAVTCQAFFKAQNPLNALTFRSGYTEVEELLGVRFNTSTESPTLEYLVKWKDGSADSWEPAGNLSEDLIRDYDERWWTACRKGDAEVTRKMLGGGKDVLANVVDENRRSALHFAAALGNVEITKYLIDAGADIDLQDKEGYTPLHMAAGYMYLPTVLALLEAGANPELRDSSGRNVVELIDSLRASFPLNLQTMQRVLALEAVANGLADRLYEEVVPESILESRVEPDGSKTYLVQFNDGRDDEWLPASMISQEVVDDFEAGLECVEAAEVLDVVQVNLDRKFKIRWKDDYPDSWEPEEQVPPSLIEDFRARCPELFEERTRISPDNNAHTEYQTQYAVKNGATNGAANGAANGTTNGAANGGGSTPTGEGVAGTDGVRQTVGV